MFISVGLITGESSSERLFHTIKNRAQIIITHSIKTMPNLVETYKKLVAGKAISLTQYQFTPDE